MTSATVRHVERAITDGLKPVTDLDKRLGSIESQNAAQMVVLEQQNGVLLETRSELVQNRIEREKRVAIEEVRAKVEKDAKDQREADLAARAERTKRLAVYATVIACVVGGLVAILVAAINSHVQHEPSPASVTPTKEQNHE